MNRDESTSRSVGDAVREGAEVTRHMAETAASAAAGMFGRDITIIDLTEIVSYTDYFVVASAETDRQMRRIVEEVIDKMREEGYRPRSRNYEEGSVWISLDFLDVVVHVFTDEGRDYYRLEALWRAAPQEKWAEEE